GPQGRAFALDPRLRGSDDMLLRLAVRRYGDALAAVVLAAAFGDAGRLAAALAQVIQLGTPHRAAAHHLDRGDARRVQREDAFDALAVRDLAQREVGVDPGVAARDAD